MPQVNSTSPHNPSVNTSQTSDTNSSSTTVERNRLRSRIGNTRNQAWTRSTESSANQERVQTKCPPETQKRMLELRIGLGGPENRERAKRELAELEAQERTTSQPNDTTSP